MNWLLFSILAILVILFGGIVVSFTQIMVNRLLLSRKHGAIYLEYCKHYTKAVGILGGILMFWYQYFGGKESYLSVAIIVAVISGVFSYLLALFSGLVIIPYKTLFAIKQRCYYCFGKTKDMHIEGYNFKRHGHFYWRKCAVCNRDMDSNC